MKRKEEFNEISEKKCKHSSEDTTWSNLTTEMKLDRVPEHERVYRVINWYIHLLPLKHIFIEVGDQKIGFYQEEKHVCSIDNHGNLLLGESTCVFNVLTDPPSLWGVYLTFQNPK